MHTEQGVEPCIFFGHDKKLRLILNTIKLTNGISVWESVIWFTFLKDHYGSSVEKRKVIDWCEKSVYQSSIAA